MSIKSRSRFGKRRISFSNTRAISLCNRIRTKLRAAFSHPIPLPCADTRNRDHSEEDTAIVVGDALFDGASTMVDVARLAQNPPPRLTEHSHSRALSVRHIIQDRMNNLQANNALGIPSSEPEPPARKLAEISMSSLAQPSVYFEPRSHLTRRHTEEQTISGPVLPELVTGGDIADRPAIQSTSYPLHSQPPSAVAPPEESVLKLPTQGQVLGPQPSVPEAMNAQILSSSPPEPSSAQETLSPMPSSRHLASGGSSNDTFAAWRKPQFTTPEGQNIVGIEVLTDPFMQSMPEKLAQPPSDEDAENSCKRPEQGREADIADVAKETPSNTRWSDDYDQFSSDGANGVDRGYHLNTPPVLNCRIPPKYRLVAADDSSDEGEHEQTPFPKAEEQQSFSQQQMSPQPVLTTVPLAVATNEARLAMNNLAERLHILTIESHTHFWNAGFFAGRLAARDRDLESARVNVSIRDAEIRRLCDLVAERDAEIETLRRSEQPASTQNQYEDDSEMSDMYGASDDSVDGQVEDNVDDKQPSEIETDDEDEILLSPATENRRYRLDLLETASDSAVLELRRTMAARQSGPPYTN